jgi:asparagine N-glycosylation enzyme membrane subunit Stt3
MELALCQRYFQSNTYAITVAKNAVAQFMSFVWNVPFRVTPTGFTYSGFVDNDASGATAMTIYVPTANGASGFSITGTTTVGSRLLVNAAISAEL